MKFLVGPLLLLILFLKLVNMGIAYAVLTFNEWLEGGYNRLNAWMGWKIPLEPDDDDFPSGGAA